jgi:hypothetical protein
MSASEAERGPVRVELVLHDEGRPSLLATRLKGALFLGLAGAGLLATAGSFVGRALVTWQEASPSLGRCKDVVEEAVGGALTSLLGWQLGFLGVGFVLGAASGLWLLRGRGRGASAD